MEINIEAQLISLLSPYQMGNFEFWSIPQVIQAS